MIVVKNKKSLLPCDYCYRKVSKLFPLSKLKLTYFVCFECWKKHHKDCGPVYVTKVDPSRLTINPVKVENWDDVCTKGHQHQPLIHKVHKNLRKRPRS